LNENLEVLKLREKIKNEFYLNIVTLIEMVKELKSKNSESFYHSLSINIHSPMEDAIRYKYIVQVELFKRFARLLLYTYFSFDSSINKEERYKKMNNYLL
jgi:hypothetical protein